MEIRVYLVVESPLIGSLLENVLASEPDFVIAGSASSPENVLSEILKLQPDIVLISANLPGKGALQLARSLSVANEEIKIMALGLTEHKERVIQLFESGIDGYVANHASTDQLVDAVKSLYKGRPKISPKITAALIKRVSELSDLIARYQTGIEPEFDRLTKRELQVLQLISQGYSNRRIADRLVISISTVKNHVHNILKKLEVDNRHDAAAYYALSRENHQ